MCTISTHNEPHIAAICTGGFGAVPVPRAVFRTIWVKFFKSDYPIVDLSYMFFVIAVRGSPQFPPSFKDLQHAHTKTQTMSFKLLKTASSFAFDSQPRTCIDDGHM